MTANTPFRWGSEYDEARQSALRFEAIRRSIESDDGFDNPSILDLGANQGFFSQGFARAGFSVVAVEPDNGNELNPAGLDNLREHRAWVHSPEDLPEECFDYALVLSVLHHIPAWGDVFDALKEKTRIALFVETPNFGEQHPKWHGHPNLLNEILTSLRNQSLGYFPEVTRRHNRTLWRLDVC